MPDKTPEAVLPWQMPPLERWAIVGMNHYFIDGKKRLFVAMVRNGRCIKAEGADERDVFAYLAIQAGYQDADPSTPEPEKENG